MDHDIVVNRDALLQQVQAQLGRTGVVIHGVARSGVGRFVGAVTESFLAADPTAMLWRASCRGALADTLYEALCAGSQPGIRRISTSGPTSPASAVSAAAVRRLAQAGSAHQMTDLVGVIGGAAAAAATTGTLLFVLDDLDRCAPEDLYMLRKVVTAAAAGGARMLLSLHDADSTVPATTMTAVLHDLGALADFADIVLGPLSGPAVQSLVEDALEAAVDPVLLDEIIRLSGALPGLAHDVVQELRRYGRIRTIDGAAYLVSPARTDRTHPATEVDRPPLAASTVEHIAVLAGIVEAMHRTAAVHGPADGATELLDSRFPVVRAAGHRIAVLGGTARTSVSWTDVSRVTATHRLRIPSRSHGDGALAAGELLGFEVIARLRGSTFETARRAVVAGMRSIAVEPTPDAEACAVAVLQMYAGHPVAARRLLARASARSPELSALSCLADLRALLRRGAQAGAAVVIARGPQIEDPAAVTSAIVEMYRGGRWDEALDAAAHAEAYLAEKPLALPCVHRAVAAEILWHRGSIDRAADWLDRGGGIPLFAHLLDWARAGVLAASGDLGAAREAAAAARARARYEHVTATAGMLLGRQIRLDLSAGDLAAAMLALRRLRVVAASHGGAPLRMEVLVGEARLLRTAAAGLSAVAAARGLGGPVDVARACVAAAGCADVEPDGYLDEALEIYGALGATHSRALVASMLRARRRRVTPEVRDADGRTASEARLADLLGCGHSNRVIAAVLVRSEKRVEAMVSALSERTGVRGRLDLARQLASRPA